MAVAGYVGPRRARAHAQPEAASGVGPWALAHFANAYRGTLACVYYVGVRS